MVRNGGLSSFGIDHTHVQYIQFIPAKRPQPRGVQGDRASPLTAPPAERERGSSTAAGAAGVALGEDNGTIGQARGFRELLWLCRYSGSCVPQAPHGRARGGITILHPVTLEASVKCLRRSLPMHGEEEEEGGGGGA